MKKIATLIATVALASVASASLKKGDSLTPYEITNVDTGKKYCQVCAYSTKDAKIVAFGKMDDAKFWADLQSLQKLHAGYESKGLGVFAQVIDSKDLKAINAKAKKMGISFPVVVANEKDWDEAYKVEGVSRTVYYAKKNRVAWSGVGLDGDTVSALEAKVMKDAKG